MPIINENIDGQKLSPPFSESTHFFRIFESTMVNCLLRKTLKFVWNNCTESCVKCCTSAHLTVKNGHCNGYNKLLTENHLVMPGDDIELSTILSEGNALIQQAEVTRELLCEKGVPKKTALSLKSKCGYIMGAAAALACTGVGAGLYVGHRAQNKRDRYSTGVQPGWNVSDTQKVNSVMNYSVPYYAALNDKRHHKRHIDHPQPILPTKNKHSGNRNLSVKPKCYTYTGNERALTKKEVACPLAAERQQPKRKKNKPSPFRYIYTDKQPAKCKTVNFKNKCHKAHADSRKNNKNKIVSPMVLKMGKTHCLCPPPDGVTVKIVPPHIDKINHQSHIFTSSKPPSTLTKTTTSGSVIITDVVDKLNPYKTGQGTFFVRPSSETDSHYGGMSEHFVAPKINHLPSAGESDATYRQSDREDVKIEKMYDFSCIDNRNEFSWAAIIRQLGRTLSYPVDTLAEESQIIYHYNLHMQGCPSNQESQELSDITRKIDSVLTQILTLLPYSQPVIVLQLIIGPALEVFADELEGKSLDSQKINDINQQILFMAKHAISFLSPKQAVNLHKKTKSISKPVPKFISSNSRLAIKLRGKDYYIFDNASGFPTIRDGLYDKSVYYNWASGEWNLLPQGAEGFYSYYNNEMIETYRNNMLDLSKEAEFVTREGFITVAEGAVDSFTKNYLYMNGRFVQITTDSVSGNDVVYPYSSAMYYPNIIRKDVLWFFEQESTKIDYDFESFLEKADVFNLVNLPMTNILTDGFSYDDYGGKYIKRKGRYYPVECTIWGDEFIKSGNLKYIISNSNSGFYIKGLRLVGSDLFVKLNRGMFISKSLRNKIEKEGEVLTGEREDENYSGKIAILNNGRKGFRLNENLYSVEFTDNADATNILLKSKNKDIKLYLLNKAVVEGRDVLPWGVDELEQYGKCLFKRSPVAASFCKHIYVTNKIKNLLKDGRGAVKPDPNKLFMVDTYFPGAYREIGTEKIFFKYNEQYFDAEWVDKGERLLSHNSLQLYKIQQLSPEKIPICRIVSVEESNRFYIATEEEEFARRALVADGTSAATFNTFKYPGIIPRLRERLESVKLDDIELKAIKESRIRNMLSAYFGDHKYEISRGLKFVNGVTNEFLFEGKISAKQHLVSASRLLDLNLNSIKEMDAKTNLGISFRLQLEAYFGRFLPKKDQAVLNAMISRYRTVMILAKGFLKESYKNNYQNILFAATEGKKVPVGGAGYHEIQTLLSAKELDKVPFMVSTFEHHTLPPVVTVFPEKLYLYNPEHQQSYRHYPTKDMSDTFIHEFTHAAAATQDYMYFTFNTDGTTKSAHDIIKEFDKNIVMKNYNDDLHFLFQQYFSSLGRDIPVDLLGFLNSNGALKSYILMNNAASYEIFVRDIAKIVPNADS
ncbi:type III secretion system protein [Erwinia pyrifoliae]|uniref:type III secretion system protein n=1 Tax=Erwinia pyrifoliae TaxID=79967 RepID=UPI00223AA3EC|nr:type III secretion system protein [Erwinia pyrifoliae]MCT2387379.1 type III secretion system protein [Erwinia pyrifoliae]